MLNGAGILWQNGSWAPKLALDLEGGTQIILAPKLENGKAVTAEQLNQAVTIIRQRIDSAGVSEAEINTQGGTNVVVSIPGTPDKATLDRIESSAKLEFRPVLVASDAATTAVSPSASPSPSDTASPAPTPSVSPSNASDLAWVSPDLQKQFDSFDCKDIEEANTNVAPPDKPLVTCSTLEKDAKTGAVLPQEKFILGPVEVAGRDISDATNSLVANSQGVSTGAWGVNIVFNSTGSKQFAAVTERLYSLTGNQHRFAIVLDGQVISAPTTNAVITDGKPQITGNFTQETSKTLADQLKYGALPIGFTVNSNETISATLGTTQLASGLLAGLIGLILVVGYSVLQYRALAVITISSLVIAAVITYLIVSILSWREGYRLSLAGVAGLIVAIGITADSFIVYFERIRDELRDGRNLESRRRSGLETGGADDLRLRHGQLPRRDHFVHPRGGQRQGLCPHARTDHPRRRARGDHLHPPDAATARPHRVLRRRAPLQRSRPQGPRRRLPRAGPVQSARGRLGGEEGSDLQGSRQTADHRRAEGRRGGGEPRRRQTAGCAGAQRQGH